MTLLLVDDRDGRIVAELESQEEALLVLESLADEDPDTADSLCIVVFHDRSGGMVGTESSVTLRPLNA